MSDKPPSLLEAWGEAWNLFWFHPAEARPLAALRILTSVGLLCYLLTWGDLRYWLANDGIYPAESAATIAHDLDGKVLIFRGFFFPGLESGLTLEIFRGFLILATVCLAIGFYTRIAAVVVWLGTLCLLQRLSFLAGPNEQLLATLLFYVALYPAGEYWSLDARLRGASAKPSQFANIALRLWQIHFAVLVLTMAQEKLAGPAWWDGEAAWYLAARTLSRPLDLSFLRQNELLTNAWTQGIILAEVTFPVLVWSRYCRPLVLALSAVAWLSLPLLTGEWLVPLLLTGGWIAFLPSEIWPVSAGNIAKASAK